MESQITAGEIRLLSALAHCRIPAGTVDRRFVDLMSETAKDDSGLKLTPGQRSYVRRLAYRYRRHLPADLVESIVNPGEETGKPAAPSEPAAIEPTLLEDV